MSTASTDVTPAQRAITACMTAYTYTYQTAVIGMQNEQVTPGIIRACFDAADLCLTYANALARGSSHATELGTLTYRVTEACADAIAALEHDDPQLRTTFAATARACEAITQHSENGEVSTYNHVDEANDESFPASDPPSFNPQSL